MYNDVFKPQLTTRLMKKQANAGMDYPMRFVHANRFRKEQNKPDKVYAQLRLVQSERHKDHRNEALSKSVIINSGVSRKNDVAFGFGQKYQPAPTHW